MNSLEENQIGHELRQLVSDQPFTPDIEGIGRRARRRRRRGLALRGASAAGAAVLAAGGLFAAVHGPGGTVAGPGGTAAGATASQAPVVNSRLMSLVARIKAGEGAQPGNATLEIVRQTSGGRLMQVYYGLYTDSGDLYSGNNKHSLMRSVAQHANQAESNDSREVAAARYAVAGDLATARVRMVDATPNDFFLSYAARKKIWDKNLPALKTLLREKGDKTPPVMPTGKKLQGLINNSDWINATDALNWAGGSPQIRAGVLRLLSAIPGVTVANSRTGGQPTLTITAGPAVFGGDGSEVLTVSATTGIPVSSVSNTSGVPAGVETYRVSRVTLAHIEAGRF